jgi:hypothetical protein
MKKYKVHVNLEGRKFFAANWAEVGTTFAKSKKEATEMMYEASWGIDNDANFTNQEVPVHYVRNGYTLRAEIFKNQ